MIQIALLLALSFGSAGACVDVDLAQLSSDDAGVRELATRRLLGELPRELEEGLLALAVGADPELERRITRILVAREERLGLAVELALSRDSSAQAIGRAAFLEHLGRWHSRFDDEALPWHRAQGVLAGAGRGLVRVPACDRGGVAFLERLAEGAEFGLPVVLDPRLEASHSGPARASLGTPLEILRKMCAAERWELELRGPESGEAAIHGDRGHWLRICAASDATGSSSAELLFSWALMVRQGGEYAPRAARALATVGWSAPLAWFTKRWREEQDPVALSGLLAAAARGRVALILGEAEVQRTALAIVDRQDAADEGLEVSDEVERIARGLAQTVAAGGVEVWGAEAGDVGPLGEWARLVVFEGRRRGGALLVRSVLQRGVGGEPWLWWRALRAHVADPRHGELEFGPGVLEGAFAGGVGWRGRLMQRAGVEPEDLALVAGTELLCAELSLRAGDGAGAGTALRAAWVAGVADAADVEALLVAWRGEFGQERIARAVAGGEGLDGRGAQWERLLELAGVLAPGSAGDAGEDLQLLACGGAGPLGAEVRGLLLEELGGLGAGAADDAGEVGAFEEAWRRVGWALQEAGEEGVMRSFAAQTRLVDVDAGVREAVLRGFPPTPRGAALELDTGLLRSWGEAP